jgi:inositol-phosphate phosphatase/L-galactose 1-phosphate phosphatase/histidinol-phosphatase
MSKEAELSAAVALASAMADASGEIIRQYFRKGVAVEDKADASPVTQADRETEAAIRRLIGERFPGHGVIGEEYGADRPDAEWVWVIDPIDGTKSFISGVPLFGTLIALLHQGVPSLGVIDQPVSRERWIGAHGHASTLNGAAIKVRPCPDLARAMLFSTAPESFTGDEITRWQRVAKAVKLVRYGTDCYGYGLMAAGFCDAVVEAGLKPYDYCALVPVIEGAGGIMTDWQAKPLGLESTGRVLAAGDRAVHARLLELLA